MVEDKIEMKRENTSERAGEGYPHAIQQRLENYIDSLMTDRSEQERKEFWNNYYYIIRAGKSSVRRKMKNRLYTQQTYYKIKDIIGLSKLTGKEYIEFCMKQNDMLDSPADPEWHQIKWPTFEMEEMCRIIDSMTVVNREKISKLISMYQPGYYKDFQDKLYSQINSNSKIQSDKLTSASNTLTIDNLGSRMRLTLEYLRGDTLQIPLKVCNKIGLYYQPTKEYYGVHEFLIFHINDIAVFCQTFELSPHWVMYGRQPIAVLANNIQTEFIMDEFCLLPKVNQRIIYNTAKKMQNNSTENNYEKQK